MVDAPYRCPSYGTADPAAYVRCQRSGCPDGRDPRPQSRIADLEREIAELRANLDAATDLQNSATRAYAEQCEEIETLAAENARLRALPLKDEVEQVLEPFDNLASAVFYVDENGRELNGTKPDDQPLWGFDRVELTYGHLRAARAILSRLRAGEQELWREITEDDQPPLDTDVIMGCWETSPKRHWATEIGHYGSKRGGWIHGRMTHWLPLDRLPAAPSEHGGDQS